MLPLIPILLVLGVLLADSGLLLDIGLASESGSSTPAVVLLSTAPTGLVVIVCIAALAMLHSRMGGYIRDFGLSVLAVLGGAVVIFSWWGVNLLGVGLHSYGFTSGVWMILRRPMAWRRSCSSWQGLGDSGLPRPEP